MKAAVVLSIFISVIAFPAVVTAHETESTIITVDSTNFRFSPSSVTINETESVRFFWDGQVFPHNAVEENGVFDSGETASDEDYKFIFVKGLNGTFEYYCEPHRSIGMVGTITVNPVEISNETNQSENNNTNMDMEEDDDSFLPFLPFQIYLLAILSAVVLKNREIDSQ